VAGKYDFSGIKKAGAAALKAVLVTTSWGAYIIASPFKPLVDIVLKYLVEWLANKGLIIINLAVIYIDGKIDQKEFDKAMNEALEKIKTPNMTEAEKELIDEKVRKAFREFARLNDQPTESGLI
jgi:hypothetical protein